MPDFRNQQTAVCEVVRGIGDDPPHEIEPVYPAGERERGFASVFGGKPSHRSRGDIRRIRENQIVTTAGEASEKVGLDEIDAPLQPIITNVALGDLEGRT
jgi:hypothetical protein